EAQKAVQEADTKHVDETGWKQAGQKCWLWGAATALVACFIIAPTRGAAGLAALLGKKIKGIISSDRWSVYGQLKLGLRQLCWAHLKRDFQKLVDRGGAAKEYGELGLAMVSIVFENWHLFRGGGSRAALQRELEPFRDMMRSGWKTVRAVAMPRPRRFVAICSRSSRPCGRFLIRKMSSRPTITSSACCAPEYCGARTPLAATARPVVASSSAS